MNTTGDLLHEPTEELEMLREMVGQLDDPFTNFYAPEDLGDPESFDPTYGGIGALLDTSAAGEDTPGLRILYVFEGGSAKDAGSKHGGWHAVSWWQLRLRTDDAPGGELRTPAAAFAETAAPD